MVLITTVSAQKQGLYAENSKFAYGALDKSESIFEEISLVNLESDNTEMDYLDYKKRKRYSLRNKNLYSNRIYFKNKDYGRLIKTNILYDLSSTLNIGMEFSINRNNTIEISANINPWEFGDKRIKHYVAFAEYRYWQDYAYKGLYYGGMLMYGAFDMGGFEIPCFRPKDSNCWNKGNVFGMGVTAGWAWEISRTRWGYEVAAGLGFLTTTYDKYTIEGDKNHKAGDKIASDWSYSSIAPTKLSFTISYKLNTHN